MGDTVNMIDPFTGEVHAVPAEAMRSALAAQWVPETSEQATARAAQAGVEERSTDLGSKVQAVKQGILRGGSLGLTDVATATFGDDEDVRRARELRQYNALESGLGELAGGLGGAIAGVGPSGLAAKAGSSIAKTAEGAGAFAKIGAATAGGAVEGGLQGLGAGISELALSEDPVTWERAASVLSSNALFGAGVGGAAGGLFKGAEIGLGKARTALDDIAKARSAPSAADDLAAIEAKREVADELAAFRRETKQAKHAITTKDIDLPAADGRFGTKEISKISAKANKQLDNLLDNPKRLATDPSKAVAALQQQEHAFEKLLERADDLKAVYAADKSGARLTALESIPGALERNRALQAKIAEVTASTRQVASEGGKSIGEQVLGGSVFSGVTGLVSALPIPGSSWVAPIIGAKASKLITEKVFGGLAKANGQLAKRTAAAIDSFAGVAQKAAPRAPVVASKVLSTIRYAEGSDEPKRTKTKKGAPAPSDLGELYKARAAELRSQTMYDATGRTVMRPEARQALGAKLAPIRAMAPVLADRIETTAARRIEHVASQLAKQPDVMASPFGGDMWQPSDMEMRRDARIMAAAEDPHAVLERLADGSITPEDAETFRAVYPELHAQITQQITARLSELRTRLPYQKRLALSIFSGVPVDPAMHPMILSTLQASFTDEPGTNNGTEAPKPQAQFGSISKEEPTPAQERAT